MTVDGRSGYAPHLGRCLLPGVAAGVAALLALTGPTAFAQSARLAGRAMARSPLVRLGSATLHPGASFGTSVAISRNVAVVGAPSLAEGRAYVYTREGNGWREAAELRGLGTKPGNFFGGAVAVAGGTIAVGADDQDNGAGRVYVFTRDSRGWRQTAELRSAQPANGFGYSVAAGPGTIVVGALTIGPGAGGAYVFTQDGAGWHQIAALRPRTALPTSSFGFSVATSGQFAVVGDPGYGGGAGRTYVFGRAQKGWGQTSELTGRDTRPGDSFGYSVAISAGQILVSAPWHKAGEAYVFRLAHQNWRQTAGITGQPIGYDQFGYSVALDGTVAVVGAPGLNTGAAYLFDQVGGNWGPAAEIAAPSPADRFFGNAAAISGTAVLIAANGYNAAAGAVWAATVLNPPGRYAPPGTGRADKGARLWSATGQSQEPMTVGQPDRLHEVSLRAFMLSHPPGVY